MRFPIKIIAFFAGFVRGFRAALGFPRARFDVCAVIGEASFGHKITSLDYLARLFQGNKVHVFWYPLTPTNPCLLEYYGNYLSYAMLEPFWAGASAAVRGAELKGLRAGLGLGFAFGDFRGFLPDCTLLYKCLNRHGEKMKVFGVWEGAEARTYETFYSHDLLLEAFPLERLGLGRPEWLDFEGAMSRAVGKPVSKIAGFLLRRDAALHQTLHDKVRDVGDLAAYEGAVRHLSSAGYTVLVAGVKSWPEVEALPNVYLASRLPLDQDLLNFAMLTKSKLLVCQHSGPVHLANIAGVPLVISDFLPLWQGSAGPRDLFVPKTFYAPSEKRTVPLREIFSRHPRLFFGDYRALQGLELRGADSGDILAAVKELEAELEKPGSALKDPELAACYQNYLSLVPKPSLHHIRKNRVSSSILRREFKDS